MPSLSGFLQYLNIRVRMILTGDGFCDKIRLLFWAIFASTPRSLLKAFKFAAKPISSIANQLAKRTVINLKGDRFRLVDSESVEILSYDFERWMWKYLKLKKGDVFLDVGAHIGKYTIPLAKIVGESGLVIAVEPHPENYATLQANIKLNTLKNVKALNIAAWNRKALLKIFIGDRAGHHSIKKNFGFGRVKVQGLALDNVLDELGVRKVDYIKIDVEGSEIEVLEGLEDSLKRSRPVIIVEVKENSINRLIELAAAQHGYKLEHVEGEYYILKPL